MKLTKAKTQLAVLGTVTACAAAVMALYPLPASACCGDGAVAANGSLAAGDAIVAAIGTATSTIADLLVDVSDTVSAVGGKIVEAIDKSSASNKVVHEGRVAVEGQMKMNEAAAIAALNIWNPTLNGQRNCYDLASSTTLGTALTGVSANNQSVQARVNYYRSGSSDIRTDMAKRYDDDMTYMDQAQEAARYYQAPVNASKTIMANADEPLDDAGVIAASRFTMNVAGEPPSTPKNVNEVSKTDAGKQWLAANNTFAARASVALVSMENAVLMRKVDPALTPASMGVKAPGITAMSPLQAMKMFVENRFVDQDWYRTLVQYDTNGQLRELNKLMAFKSWMDYQSYTQMERVEQNLAAQVGILNEIAVNLNPNYNRNREAAIRSIGSTATP